MSNDTSNKILTLKEIEASLNKFNQEYPRPNMESLIISDAYSIYNDFESPFPNSEYPGVYIIANQSGKILRVGKASCGNNLGKRLSTYYRWHKTQNRGVPKHKYYKGTDIIYTIMVPKNRAFEASAIEEYLLASIDPPPPHNTVGT